MGTHSTQKYIVRIILYAAVAITLIAGMTSCEMDNASIAEKDLQFNAEVAQEYDEMTKGAVVSDLASFKANHTSFDFLLYDGTDVLSKVATLSGDHYVPDSPYRWRMGKTLDIYALAPASSATLSQSASKTAQFSYTIPSAFADQKDVMFGYYTGTVADADGAANLHFYHPLCGVKFTKGDIEAGTDPIIIKTISLVNVKDSGTCTANCSSATPSFSWNTGSSSLATYSVTLNKTLTSETTNLLPDGTSFFMIPQILDNDAKIDVELSIDGGTYYYHAYCSLKNTTWQQGKMYIFTLKYDEEKVVTIDISLPEIINF